MKQIALGMLLGVLLVAGVTAARAALWARHGWCGHGWRHHAPISHIARELNLSRQQSTQVRAMWSAERPTVAGMLREMLGGAHSFFAATTDGKFDQGKVHAIATAEGDNFAKLLEEAALFKSRIYATVLNEKQRQSADEMQ
jgi:Spy/CpxP family protein refolding chaperone